MEGIEITAATVEEAIVKAEAQLGMSRDEFEVEIIRGEMPDISEEEGEEAIIRVNPIGLPGKDAIKVVTEILDTLLGLLGVTGKVEILSDEIPL
ncbi:MAG: Jag N-terminal domain-containing protein, partial [Chloroflexota bacterium]